MDKKLRTHYSNLQVTENANPEVIKGAYRYLAQKYHPDRNPGNREKHEKIMNVLNEAYRVLSDPELRKQHDNWIKIKRLELNRENEIKDSQKSRSNQNSNSTQEKEKNEFKKTTRNPRRKRKGNGELIHCKSCDSLISKFANSCPKCGSPRKLNGQSRLVASILALVLGGLGVHRFYLGQWWGIFYLLFVWTGIPMVIALFESLFFLFSSQEKWEAKYGYSQNTSGWLIAVIGIFGFIFSLSIISAIAIPAYQDYSIRKITTEGVDLATNIIPVVEAYAIENRAWPSSMRDIGFNSANTGAHIRELGITNGGIIYIIFSGIQTPQIKNKTIALIPSVNQENYIEWQCKSSDIKSKYLPAHCR